MRSASDGARALVVTPANGELALRYYRPGSRRWVRQGAAVGEVDVVTVAGSPDPGKEPALPRLVGTTLGVAGFGPPRSRRPDVRDPALPRRGRARRGDAGPAGRGALRRALPSVDVLPAGR